MLKISSKASIILSLVFSAIFFVLLLVGAVIMPSVLEYFLNGLQGAGVSSPFFNSTFLLLMAYGVLAVAFLADTLLFLLLLRIRAGLVFTSRSVSLIRGVSWCCFLLGALFIVLAYPFPAALVVTFAAVFLGLCLRVVKNVMEEAVEIKTENDFTV